MSRRNWRDDYEIREKLRAGAFSKVCEVVLKKDPTKQYAAKFLDERGGSQAQERFANEYAILLFLKDNGLVHDNIVNLIELFPPNVLILEYCKGMDLVYYLSEYSSSNEEKVSISEGILKGVEFLHVNKIVHGDLKLDHVILRLDDCFTPQQVKIVDFGAAQRIGECGYSTNVTTGTPVYSAPESLGRKKIILAYASDIWSIGIMIRSIAARDLPFAPLSKEKLEKLKRTFPKETDYEIRMRWTHKQIGLGLHTPPLEGIVSPRLAAILSRVFVDCFEIEGEKVKLDTERRRPTATELLDSIRGGGPSLFTDPRVEPVTPPPASRAAAPAAPAP